MSITKIFLSLIFFIPLFASNALLDSASPYLRQHAHNPVNWVTWDAGILKRAKAEHKPIFYLSVIVHAIGVMLWNKSLLKIG